MNIYIDFDRALVVQVILGDRGDMLVLAFPSFKEIFRTSDPDAVKAARQWLALKQVGPHA